MADVLQPIITRIDTTSNWKTLNPIPANGEQCIEILGKGVFKLKVGDGVTPWMALKYATLNSGVIDLEKLVKQEIRDRIAGDEDLDERKVEKSADSLVLYGTDLEGNQVTYDISSFGRTLEEIPEASEQEEGIIIQYKGETTEQFIHGYFYECVDTSTPETIDFETNVEPAESVEFNSETFLENIHPTEHTVYMLTYVSDEDAWYYNGQVVDPAEYGVTYDSQYIENGSNFRIEYTPAEQGEYVWERVSVQPETDLTPVWEAIEELDNRKIDHFEVLPSAEENLGLIAQYIGEDTEDYKTGLFYEAIHHEEASDYNVISSNEELVITADKEYFEEHQEHDHDLHFEFAWDGQHWKDENEHVLNLHAMGITIEGEPEVGDTLVIDYKAEISEYVWNKVDTTDISEKVDKTHLESKIYGTDEHGEQHLYDKEEISPKYTAEEPATVSVGGFNVGDQPVDMSFVDFADTLLHKYVAPTISNTISPNGTSYQLGTHKDITMAATITRNAPSKYPFISLTFYDNGVQKQKITDGINVKTGTWSYEFTNVGTTSNTKYYTEELRATVVDSQGSYSTSRTISFVAPTFYGKVRIPDEYDDTPAHVKTYLQTNIETILDNLTKTSTTGSTIDNSCTLTKEHYIFVTPFTWTGTKKIYDTITNMDYTNSTSSFTHNHTENGVTTGYNVYYLKDYAGNGDSFVFRLTVSVTKG